MAKILFVEDESELVDVVKKWLEEEDFHLVESASDGNNALSLLKERLYDLLILDLTLPGLDGLEVCSRYGKSGGTLPIIMLTARKSLEAKESGLNAGADDYLTKPFQLRELSARVRAILRRQGTPIAEFRAGDLVLDRNAYAVFKNSEEVHLLPKEFMLLEYLMRKENRVVSVDTLIDQIWGTDSLVTAETVRSNIKTLRKKIDTAGKDSLITNVYGIGYKITSK